MAKTASIFGKLKLYDGTSAYDEITNIVSISGASASMSTIDATHLGSASYFKEYLAGYLDGGDVTVVCHLDPEVADGSNQRLVKAHFEARTSEIYRIVLPTGPYASFTAFVTGWNTFQLEQEAVVGLEFTLKITGAITYADAE
tara:strand:- start:10203 stop:10631 length:429 start_codon:yes stop_codon:yes gene_type:complete